MMQDARRERAASAAARLTATAMAARERTLALAERQRDVQASRSSMAMENRWQREQLRNTMCV